MNIDDVTAVLTSWRCANHPPDGDSLVPGVTELLAGDERRARWMIATTDELLRHLSSASALTDRIREIVGDAQDASSIGAAVATVATAVRNSSAPWSPDIDAAWRHACRLIDEATRLDHAAPFSTSVTGAPDMSTRSATTAATERRAP